MPQIWKIIANKVKSVAGPALSGIINVSGGRCFSVAVDSTGKIWTWGANAQGQLGDNTIIDKCTPINISGATKTFCQIASEASHTLAIDKNGQVWGWGVNSSGQLGDNTTVSKRTPVSVAGATKTFCKISAGAGHSLAIDKNGQAWGWGNGFGGPIGDNTTTNRCTPVSVVGTTKTFCEIDGGSSFSVGIDKNGQVWGWGFNSSGQLGDNTTVSKLTPVSVVGTTKTFCKIAAGNAYTIAIDKNGRVWGWGQNSSGNLGDNTTVSKRTPVSIAGAVKTFCQIYASNSSTTLAIDKNGQAWGWGGNNNGEIGNGTLIRACTPIAVGGSTKTFCKIFISTNHTLAIDKNGKVWAWGGNSNGQLGDATISKELSPVSILGTVKTFCEIAAGSANSLAIDKNGRVWGWGQNSAGQLGDNTKSVRFTPISVLGAVRTFCKVSIGNAFSLAIDKNGRAWSWGNNNTGQLGDGTTNSTLTPVSIAGAVKTFCQISGASNHSLAIDKNGRAWSWGSNNFGLLGDNSFFNQSTPVSVAGTVKTFCQIVAGGISMALDKNGMIWSWGPNFVGALGDGTTLQKCTPVSVAGATKTFCKISSGNVSIAIDKNGQAWGWGSNSTGAIGNNSTTNQCTPVSVLGAAKTFCEIAAGSLHSVAIDKNGKVWAWGGNSSGQLGDGTLTSKLTPVSVAGATKTFCKISAGVGSCHTIAVDKNGRVWAWGNNPFGELGNNYTRLTPVEVCNI